MLNNILIIKMFWIKVNKRTHVQCHLEEDHLAGMAHGRLESHPPPWQIDTIQHLEIEMKEWPSGVTQGKILPNVAKRGQTGPNG